MRSYTVRLLRPFSLVVALALGSLSLAPLFATPQEAAKSADSADKGASDAPNPPSENPPGKELEKSESPKSDPANEPVAGGKAEATPPPSAPSESSKPENAENTPAPRKVTPREKPVAKKQLRWLAMSGNYEDFVSAASFDPTDLLLGGGSGKSKSFYKLCDYLDEMGAEENLAYVLFDLSDTALSFNPAQLDEFSRRLSLLKSKGKKTIAWLENAENVQLAIASQCDEVFMADFGTIDMPSAAMQTMFYRDAMDLVGIKASVVRAGDFKGAVEPYLNPSMSDHLRDHYRSMLESINSARVSLIAKGRGLTTAAVRDLQKKRRLLPAEALAAGLVTQLVPYGSMKKAIQKSIGDQVEWTKPKTKPKREVSLFELIGRSMSAPKDSTSKLRDESLVVLHLHGTIVDGKSNVPGSIVSGPTVKVIEDLISDEKVRGVVVRINSPGGSATASEAIRQALAELAKAKPLLFSMGDVAASGGYWITCIGEPIYAEQGTVTGSIGVFSLKLSFGSLLRRVGVHLESIALDSSAAADAFDRVWSDEEITSMQKFIDQVYDKFLAYASDSRKIPLDKLKTLAGGRVWSGEQAKKIGLVDEIGGVDDCLAAVAKKSQLSKYKVIHRPEPSSGMDILSLLGGDEDESIWAQSMVRDVESQWQKSLGSLGFKLDSLRTMLRYSQIQKSNPATVWAMMADEYRIN